MQTFKRIVSFLIIICITFAIAHFTLAQPSVLNILLKEFHQGSYTTIILGESRAETGVNPFLLSDDSGEAYSLARRLLPFPEIFYLLKEANLSGNLKTVYLEIDPIYWESNFLKWVNRGNDVNTLYHISWKLKPEYIWNVSMKRSAFTIGDFSINSDVIKKIPKYIEAKIKLQNIDNADDAINTMNEIVGLSAHYDYMGRGFRYGKSINLDSQDSEFSKFSPDKVNIIALSYFDKIVNYCNEKGIKLICFSLCIPPERLLNENHEIEHNYFSRLCTSRNIQFIDMNYVKKDYLNYCDDDFVDTEGHMMGHLADKHTKILKEIAESSDPETYFYNDYADVRQKFQ